MDVSKLRLPTKQELIGYHWARTINVSSEWWMLRRLLDDALKRGRVYISRNGYSTLGVAGDIPFYMSKINMNTETHPLTLGFTKGRGGGDLVKCLVYVLSSNLRLLTEEESERVQIV
jgi:hypothetical protein